MKKSIGVNTLVYPNPVWCIGTYTAEGAPNVSTIAWGGIACSSPASVSISLRKATASYDAILERKAFTVCVPSTQYVAEADYFGIASGANTNKFKDTGLTPVKGEFVDAPYVDEFPLIVECTLIHHYEIGLHTQFIGEIVDIKVDEKALGEKDRPLMDKVAPFVYGHGIREYWSLGEMIGTSFEAGKKFKKEFL